MTICNAHQGGEVVFEGNDCPACEEVAELEEELEELKQERDRLSDELDSVRAELDKHSE